MLDALVDEEDFCMSDYVKLLEEAERNVLDRARSAGVSAKSMKEFIVNEFAAAVEHDDECTQHGLFELTCTLENSEVKADTLHSLLLLPGHTFHQQVVRAIQQLAHPASVPCLDMVLSEGFGVFNYTCSTDGVVAKWFSHALAAIGTQEAIGVIRKFARSPNAEIANEMKYRLERI